MTTFMQFADFTHDSVDLIPAVKGTVVALYVTGTPNIVATAADIQKYRAAGAGVILIDQSPGLEHFAAGDADVADVENGAGTYASCAEAVAKRQAKGWASTIYLNQSDVNAQAQALASKAGVSFGVANWNDSVTVAETGLDDSADWAYVQYGDPVTNPHTVVPGTSITLAACNADINVGKAAFVSAFLPAPKPPPDPAPAANPSPCEGAWRWVVPAGNVLSLVTFAGSRGATVLGILKISSEKLDTKNFGLLNAYVTGGVDQPMPENLVFYTVNP